MSKELLQQHFFFARHAETDWNHQKLCQGQQDIPLNEKGLIDANKFALDYQHFHIPCIVSSPLTRALQTAKALHLTHPQATFHIVAEFSERYWGALEGMSSEEMYAIEKLEEQDPLYAKSDSRVEPRNSFRQRVLSAIATAQTYHPHPLIVSHGRVFMELCSILGMGLVRQIPNCQLFRISHTPNGWISSLLEAEESDDRQHTEKKQEIFLKTF